MLMCFLFKYLDLAEKEKIKLNFLIASSVSLNTSHLFSIFIAPTEVASAF